MAKQKIEVIMPQISSKAMANAIVMTIADGIRDYPPEDQVKVYRELRLALAEKRGEKIEASMDA